MPQNKNKDPHMFRDNGSIILLVFFLGILAFWFKDTVVLKTGNLKDVLISQLLIMGMIALLIERSVEVYLNATSQNGPPRNKINGSTSTKPPATKPATLTAVILGVLVALTGVRILNVFIETMPTGGYLRWLFAGIDILLSGGLLAGGSGLFHEIIERIISFLPGSSQFMSGGDEDTSADIERVRLASDFEYQIHVQRTPGNNGTLRFNEGGVLVETTCWWDPKVRITPGNYTRCSATRMATKTDSVTDEKRPAIFLPAAVAPDTGKNTIFIHEGKNSNSSDGCIVIDRGEMMRMWNVIEKDAKNVTVQVVDA